LTVSVLITHKIHCIPRRCTTRFPLHQIWR